MGRSWQLPRTHGQGYLHGGHFCPLLDCPRRRRGNANEVPPSRLCTRCRPSPGGMGSPLRQGRGRRPRCGGRGQRRGRGPPVPWDHPGSRDRRADRAPGDRTRHQGRPRGGRRERRDRRRDLRRHPTRAPRDHPCAGGARGAGRPVRLPAHHDPAGRERLRPRGHRRRRPGGADHRGQGLHARAARNPARVQLGRVRLDGAALAAHIGEVETTT